jgi:hypothetical protein
MDNLLEEFINIRQRVLDKVVEMTDVYFTNIWDPIMKYVIIKETNQLIKNEISKEFPDFPKKYFPKIKFSIYDYEYEVEVGVQSYLNTMPELTFLGNTELEGVPYDFYIQKSFDPSIDYMFYARYGHEPSNFYSGAKTAAAEYFTGTVTPLAIAFAMAVEDGYIK